MDAIVIPLNSWQNPQGEVLLIYSERECSIFFGCWSAAGEPVDHICRLSFHHAAAVRSFPREFQPFKISEHLHRSYILRVPDSDMQRDYIEYRRKHYPARACDPAGQNHFVVIGHDIYHEVLATSFSETKILASDLKDQRLLDLWQST